MKNPFVNKHKAMEDNRPREGWGSSWYLLFIFIALTIGIGASGYSYYKSQEQKLFAVAKNQLGAVADLKVKQIVAWRDERIQDATAILKDPMVLPFIHQYLDNPADPALTEKLSSWMNARLEAYHYKTFILADAQGNTRLAVPHRDKQLRKFTLPLIAEALRTRKIIFSDFHFDPDEHFIHLSLVIPLCEPSAKDSAPFGFMVLEIDPYQFLYPLIQTWPTPSRTAETLLVRREGNEVVFLNELRHRKNTALTLRIPISRKDLPSARVMRGEQRERVVTEGVDYRGVPVLATLRKIPDSPWYLVAKIDADEINASIKERTWSLAIIVALLILFSGAGFGLLWRNQKAQLYKKQYETEIELATERKKAEKALQESEKKYRTLFESSTDAIMMLTKDGFFDGNQAAFDLFGFSSKEDFVKMHPSELSPPTQPDGKDSLTASLQHIETAFAKGKDSFEWIHKKTDGTLFPAEVRLSSLLLGEKTVLQGLVRDITDRKRAEEENKKYQTLFETSNDAIMMMNEDRFVDGNQATLDLFGFTSKADFITKSPADLSPPTQADGTDSLTAQKRHLPVAS